MFVNYWKNLAILKASYRDSVERLKYWHKIEKMFKLNNYLGRYTFTCDFKHKSYFDDESMITAIAEKYGYKIVKEDLTLTKSSYTFKRV